MTDLTFYIFCGFQEKENEIHCELIKVIIPDNDEAKHIKNCISGYNDEIFMCLMEDNEYSYGEHHKGLSGKYCLWGFVVEDPNIMENKGEVTGTLVEYIMDLGGDFESIDLETVSEVTPEKVDAMLKNIVTENDIKSLEKYHW